MPEAQFRLNPALDADALAATFAAERRLHVPDFLVDEDARALHQSLVRATAWELGINHGKAPHFFDPGQLTAQQKEQLTRLARLAAPDALHYRFERIIIPDGAAARAASEQLYDRFAAFMSSAPVLDLMRRITGAEPIAFADAMATAYGEGDFLELHDDTGAADQNRHAAYVFNLSPEWRADWGGLLLFLSPEGHVERGFTPLFNALNLFAVPQRHIVSMVTPAARSRRYSISGWLRSGTPPA